MNNVGSVCVWGCFQMALKCADICNPCRPWELSKQWSEKVTEEFFHQGIRTHLGHDASANGSAERRHVTPFSPLCLGDIEKKHKLEVSPLCDSDTNSITDVQIGKSVNMNAAVLGHRNKPQTSVTQFKSCLNTLSGDGT